jgi:UDPglucose 6-dehydrogenase
VHHLPWAGAELAKLSVNAFITSKISFANWVAQMAEGHGADPAAVLAAIGADGRIGSRTLSFGMPFGGPCFPRDNRAIALASDGLGLSAALPRATDTVNQEWRATVFKRIAAQSAGGKIAILGLAYKSGTSVTEESAGLYLARALAADGHDVVVHDPLVVQRELRQAKTVKEAVRGARVVAITTPAYTRVAVESAAVVVNPWAVAVSRGRGTGGTSGTTTTRKA